MPKIASWLKPYIDALAGLGDWFGLSPVVREIAYGYIGGLTEEDFRKKITSTESALQYLTSLLSRAAAEAGETLSKRRGNYPPALSDMITNAIAKAERKAQTEYKSAMDDIYQVEKSIGQASSALNYAANAGRDYAATDAGSAALTQIDSIVDGVQRKLGVSQEERKN